jgi:hypothetical protein
MLAISTSKPLVLFLAALCLEMLVVSGEAIEKSKVHTMPILPRSLPSTTEAIVAPLQKRRLGHSDQDAARISAQKRSALPPSEEIGTVLKKRFTPMKISTMSCKDDGTGARCTYDTRVADGEPIFEPLLHQLGSLAGPMMQNQSGAVPLGLHNDSHDDDDDVDDEDDSDDDDD